MAMLLQGRIDLLTIEPDEDDETLPDRSGEIRVVWPPDTWTDKELAVREIQVSLAGPIVEMIHDGNQDSPELLEEWQYDWALASERVREFLPKTKTVSEHLGRFIFDLMRFFERDDVWAAVAALADQLEAHLSLEQEDVEAVLEAWPIEGFDFD